MITQSDAERVLAEWDALILVAPLPGVIGKLADTLRTTITELKQSEDRVEALEDDLIAVLSSRNKAERKVAAYAHATAELSPRNAEFMDRRVNELLKREG
jgi:hypothetical protein